MYSSYSQDPAERAKAKLIFYFKAVMEKSGVGFEQDNAAELAEIICDIVEAAVDIAVATVRKGE